ncbi:MAG: hypothetical protein HXY20_13145 [Acidobacteria bacterium]|nr:hypothetical protein [Acidobacteriota bacterium]
MLLFGDGLTRLDAQDLSNLPDVRPGKSRAVISAEDYMAGQKIQDCDLYSRSLSVKDHYLGSFKLKPGKHVLRFENVGRNPLSKGNHFGLDSVRLRERWLKKRKLLG